MKPIRVGIMQRVLLKTTSQDVSAAKVLRKMDQLVKVNMIKFNEFDMNDHE
jgi:hypothetical protein